MSTTTPPRWKTAVLVWIAIYPSITLFSWLAGPMLDRLPLMLRTLVLTGILVPLLVFVLLPALNKGLRRWLHPDQVPGRRFYGT
ncbi:MAG: hypothetical protein JNL43_10535 [Flavobacteriales bacterium]|nr:hypothetical protein [Flavobacteriales bacterium]